MRGKRSRVALAVGLVVLAIPSPARAATQVGEAFPPEDSFCGDVTWLQTGSPGGQYTVPFAGVITSWTFHAPASSPPQVKFKVARPAGGVNYTILGESGLKSPPAGVATTYTDIRIPVVSGDVIGFYIGPPTGNDCGRSADPQYEFRGKMGDQPPSVTPVAFNAFPGNAFEFDVSAKLEADCDNDGFGDETQDPDPPDPSSCNPPEPQPLAKVDRTVTLDANKSKVKKGKKVTLSGRVTQTGQGGTACSANQAVELQRKKPSQTTFTTVEQLQTDAAGSFSAKEKVKKTFEYRAVLAETATCDDTLSDTEKVKVKKKK